MIRAFAVAFIVAAVAGCQTATMPEGKPAPAPAGYHTLCKNQPESPLCPKR